MDDNCGEWVESMGVVIRRWVSLACQPYILHPRRKAENLKRNIPSGNYQQVFMSNSRKFWQSNEMAVWPICHVTMEKVRDMQVVACGAIATASYG